MDQDSERDEEITSARITGISTRALAKLHHCSNREVEAAVDRRLDYAIDQEMQLRAIKLDIARIEQLMHPFFERATKDRDVAAGTLCCKLLERRALLLGLDAVQRIDLTVMPKEHEISGHDQIRAAVMRVARGPNWQPKSDGNGALAPPISPATDDQNRPEPDERSPST